MDIIEYEKQHRVNRGAKKGILAYTLGLIGSSISGLMLLFAGLFILLFGKLAKNIMTSFITKILVELEMINFLQGIENFYNYSMGISTLIFIIMLVGFILSIVGTFMSWKEVRISSCIIMILGGILSLIPLIIPGLLVIIGASINLFDYVKQNS
ncbi:hypothetical protein [Candidatus Arthromitus sp. SFB-rat-Yit]|uniref:hypothetical protein n=1 Tax=Candidatus Arthromitus sp. SFB-rat-Yit TaxID=1041504 RepID=UPI000227A4FD|nr:hypothetical protein [Candidatus Arthromitus sp. SFB-rat-Yit]BAK81582.1 hypothetical protein RATSFB_1020 [Candidatus Arthromitus sp. SFB-rat-Yit]